VAKSKSSQARKSQQRSEKARSRTKKRRDDLATISAAHSAADRLIKKKRADSLAHFVTDEYEFWLVHGLNFLSSDYNQGLWEPLFPEAYQEGFIALDRTTITRRFMSRYLDTTTNKLSVVGTKCLAWLALKPDEMFELMYRLRKAQPPSDVTPAMASRRPANPSVWAGVHEAMNLVSAGLDAKGQTKGGQFTLPEGGVEALTQ
jgi:hypothetical protein